MNIWDLQTVFLAAVVPRAEERRLEDMVRRSTLLVRAEGSQEGRSRVWTNEVCFSVGLMDQWMVRLRFWSGWWCDVQLPNGHVLCIVCNSMCCCLRWFGASRIVGEWVEGHIGRQEQSNEKHAMSKQGNI